MFRELVKSKMIAKFANSKIAKILFNPLILNLLIVAFSIILRSKRPIGTDTAIYLDLGKKIAEGKRYYYDFFETNFPVSFYFYALEHKIAKLFAIDPIIFSEITINVIGVLSIYCTAHLLKNTNIFKNKLLYNLFILGCTWGFFIRHPAILLMEFGTKSSFFIALMYPYLAMSFVQNKALSRTKLVIRGILMGLIPCIKPHYAIYLIFIELTKIYQDLPFQKNFRQILNKKLTLLAIFFSLDRLIAMAVILLYANIIIWYIPEFLTMIKFFSSHYPLTNDLPFATFTIKYFSIVATAIIGKIFTKKNQEVSIALATIIAASCCFISESIFSFDQSGAFNAMILASSILIFYYYLLANKETGKKYWLYLSIICLSTPLVLILYNTVEFFVFLALAITIYAMQNISQNFKINLIVKFCLISSFIIIYLLSLYQLPYFNARDERAIIILVIFICILLMVKILLALNCRENIIKLKKILGFCFIFIAFSYLLQNIFSVLLVTKHKSQPMANFFKINTIVKFKTNSQQSIVTNVNIVLFPLVNYNKFSGQSLFHGIVPVKEVFKHLQKSNSPIYFEDKNSNHYKKHNAKIIKQSANLDIYHILHADNIADIFNRNNKFVAIEYGIYGCESVNISDYIPNPELQKKFFQEYQFYRNIKEYKSEAPDIDYFVDNITRRQITDLDIYIRKDLFIKGFD